jgi:endonuclease YncB( thermonuclease family)
VKKLYIIPLFIILLGCEHPESKEYDSASKRLNNNLLDGKIEGTGNRYKVIGVKDGDTFVLLINGREQVIRFAHIDCPEKNQPFGHKAKQFVSEMCFGKYVTLIQFNKFDRYKRLIAEVILEDGTNLNKELIKNGLAWHFKKYSKDTNYEELELQARLNKIGLWRDSNPIAPWDWRKQE